MTTGVRLDLADPDDYLTPKVYVEEHLAAVATELHRLLNEFMTPGVTSEESAVDMTTGSSDVGYFQRLDRHLDDSPKHVLFDGSAYFSLPKALLKAKQAKVQFVAVLYVKGGGEADFRLVRDDGAIIQDSLIRVTSPVPAIYSVRLPFGDQPGSVSPDSRVYYIQAGALKSYLPVCRRFSLSFVYI